MVIIRNHSSLEDRQQTMKKYNISKSTKSCFEHLSTFVWSSFIRLGSGFGGFCEPFQLDLRLYIWNFFYNSVARNTGVFCTNSILVWCKSNQMKNFFRLWLWWILWTFSTGLTSLPSPARALMASLELRFLKCSSIFYMCVCVCTGVTAQLFSIIWWCRACKPYIF